MPQRPVEPPRRISRLARHASAILAACACLTAVPTVAGRDQSGQADGPAARSSAATGEVQVSLERFGVGNQARPGDWFGIRISLTDSASSQRELIVRLQSVDADGDKPSSQISLTSNPGLTQQVWLYARLPFTSQQGTGGLIVHVHEAIEAGDRGEPGAAGYRVGRLLASLPVTPKAGSLVAPTVGLIGVVGQRGLGLQQYSDRAGMNAPWHKVANEATDVVTGVTPEELPDRWMGLSAFDAVVWADGDPAKLRGDRAGAMRDYVQRGGHLVVILPPVGQTWTNAASNELIDLMPSVELVTRERVDFEPYRPLLTLWDNPLFPKTATVHAFKPRADAAPGEATSILAGPDGESVVMRREVGAGCVTLVGLDLNQTALSQFKLIDAEVLWHRILGRRGNLLEPEVDAKGASGVNLAATANRKPVACDGGIPQFIGKSGSSATGVVVGFIVFALYWAVAGPVGFALLKRRGMSQHSWVFFIAASLVFTALAWGGATLLRPKRIEASHLTLLDHVYGQPRQRARMWASLLLPWYGSATLGVGDPVDLKDRSSSRRSLNAIAAWEASDDSAASSFGGFPDARGYPVDARTPDLMTVPTRQTVKQVEATWSGGPRWEMPIPVVPEGSTAKGELKLNEAAWFDLDPSKQAPLVLGSLAHKFPAPLTDLLVIVVRHQRTLPAARARSGSIPDESPLICDAEAFRYAEPWKPGEPLSLDVVTRPRERLEMNKSRLESYLASLLPDAKLYSDLVADDRGGFVRTESALYAASLFPLLPTPNHNNVNLTTSIVVPQRSSMHGFDVGRWFTRPCVIIIGLLGKDSPCESPVPLLVDGEPVPTAGLTLVRWVYPFPADPPRFPRLAETGMPAAQPAAK